MRPAEQLAGTQANGTGAAEIRRRPMSRWPARVPRRPTAPARPAVAATRSAEQHATNTNHQQHQQHPVGHSGRQHRQQQFEQQHAEQQRQQQPEQRRQRQRRRLIVDRTGTALTPTGRAPFRPSAYGHKGKLALDRRPSAAVQRSSCLRPSEEQRRNTGWQQDRRRWSTGWRRFHCPLTFRTAAAPRASCPRGS